MPDLARTRCEGSPVVYRRRAVRAGTLAVLLAITSALGCSSLTDTTMTASSSLLEAAEAFPTPAPEATPDEPVVVPYWPAPDPFEGYDLPEGWESATGGVVAPPIADPTPEPAPASWTAGPPAVEANDIIERAEAMLGIAYVWGGNTLEGLDCSAYVSRAWGLSRQTTDTLHLYSTPITKDELLPGDAMNLTKRADPRGYGHVRLFAAWANDERTRMWVYEETPRQSIYHVIAYDDRYVPLRRANFTSDVTVAPVVPAPAASPRASTAPEGAVAPGSRRERDASDGATTPRTRRSWTDPAAAIPTPEAAPALAALASFVPASTYTPTTRTRRTRSWAAPTSTVTEAPTPEPTAVPAIVVTPPPEPATSPTTSRTRRTRFWSAPAPTATEAPTPESTAVPAIVVTPTPEPTTSPTTSRTRRTRSWSAPVPTATEAPAPEPMAAPVLVATPAPEPTATPAPKRTRRVRASSIPIPTLEATPAPTMTATPAPAPAAATNGRRTRTPRASSTPAPETTRDASLLQQSSDGAVLPAAPDVGGAPPVTDAPPVLETLPSATAVEGARTPRNSKPARPTSVRPSTPKASAPAMPGTGGEPRRERRGR